jgi:hypothetical protein
VLQGTRQLREQPVCVIIVDYIMGRSESFCPEIEDRDEVEIFVLNLMFTL